MAHLKFDTASFNAVMGKLKKLPQASKAVALGSVGNTVAAAVKRNISFTDHSLADLEAMGHPYAKKRGKSPRIHTSKPHVIHLQDGTLIGALKTEVSNGGQKVAVRFDPSSAQHAKYVIEGTRFLVPRDVIWATAHQPDVRKHYMSQIVSDFWRLLQAAVR